jgi:NADPH2:quinone reductase
VKAWQVGHHGPPSEALHLVDTDLPPPIADQVSVSVEACALNFADALLCTGDYQEHPPLPFTPGLEIAGRVVAAGPDARHAVGDRVTGSPLLPHGGLAEHALARSAEVFPLGDTDAVTAAALHVTYQTGWFALHRRARLQAGETVLVHAGAGGVGSAAIELARAAGATVLATAGGPTRWRPASAGANARPTRSDDIVVSCWTTLGRATWCSTPPWATFTRSTKCIAREGRSW